jgi:hypothetical protein
MLVSKNVDVGTVRLLLGFRTIPKPAATGVRSEAARRTAEGKFTKVVFNQIGGKECRRFAAMTWKEQDAYMAKPENAVVRERYEKHLVSIKTKA